MAYNGSLRGKKGGLRRFARVTSGAFFFAVRLMTFYEIINLAISIR